MNFFKVVIPRDSVVDIVCPVPNYNNIRHYKRGALRFIGFQHNSIQTCFIEGR